MDNKNNISKTVRLPADLVVFIEEQEGLDFSKKLISLLKELRDDGADRFAMLKRYDQLIIERRERYHDLLGKIHDVAELLHSLSGTLEYAEEMIEKNKTE